jgi:hypothetical protein
MTTPLLRFIDEIARIGSNAERHRCLDVLEALIALPETSHTALTDSHKLFLKELNNLEWADVVRWIESRHTSYLEAMKELARVTMETRRVGVTQRTILTLWGDRLRGLISSDHLTKITKDRKVLCAFSSAVDATYSIDEKGWTLVLEHAAGFTRSTADDLLKKAYQVYQGDPEKDRKDVATVIEALATILYAYQHPKGNLKPNLVKQSEAERWMRQLFVDFRKASRLAFTGGGASLNIADALAGLGLESHAFWPYHDDTLAGTSLGCGGAPSVLKRCWFDDNWAWQCSDFNEVGGKKDRTGHPHPVRLSLILSFSPGSQLINVPGIAAAIEPEGAARLIFQFMGHRNPGFFFEDPAGNPGEWNTPPRFGRWRWKGGKKSGKEEPERAEPKAVENLREGGYHRVILSAFQRPGTAIKELSDQCTGMRIHHEISGAFESRSEVERYHQVIREVFRPGDKNRVRTSGMSDGELAAFTSWAGTDLFAAAPPVGKDSFIQSLFRASKVREAYDLDWLYVHGNDIDIAVVRPGKPEKDMSALRDAMLVAKVVVSAALHLRSKIIAVPPEFEPSCSPKGFLALYQFALSFASQYATDGDDRERELVEIQKQILQDGYWCGQKKVPAVVVVPVYWPDPQKGCSMTGAGDISSGVTAALAP